MTRPGVTVSRQLAAIMFTDIVGYTALMGSDEQKAFLLLNKSRNIQQPIIETHGGKWIKELGDGVLASFDTATNAVQSAMQILDQCNKVPELHLRIGIHLGDVVFQNNDVFGDGVNIAARLLQQAEPGTIFISGPVYDSVANKKWISCSFLREELLKNVREPIRLYQVNAGTVPVYETNHYFKPETIVDKNSADKAPDKSIAVLPFVNMSNDPEQDYFSDGITEEILNSLAQVKDLHVAGRTSSFHFKGKNDDLRKIGNKLNVKTVLEGSVRKQGNTLRITAQLINVEDGFHLWSEKYDRQLDDIFRIQDEIAIAITEKLKVTLLDNEKKIIHIDPTSSQEAYDLYLKGRFYFNKRGKNILKAIRFFEMALEKDPEFALAYTGLADSYCILSLYCVVPTNLAMPKAREFAQKALYLHHTPAEALTAIAFITIFYDWNWPEARKIFQEIFTTHSNYAPAHYWYSYYLSFVEKDFDRSIDQARIGTDVLEPLVPISHHILSIMHFNAGDYESGIAASRMALELDENSYPAYRGLGLNLGGMKKYDEALEAFDKAILFSERQPMALVEKSWVLYEVGKIDEINAIKNELETRSTTEYISPFLLSSVEYFTGNKQRCIEYLETSFENRDSALVIIGTYLPADFMCSDPDLQKYVARMNFPR